MTKMNFNIIDYAPRLFSEHLRQLDKQLKFSNARLNFDLTGTNSLRNYVITGNEGTGVEEAVETIFNRWEGRSNRETCSHLHAEKMFETTLGYESAINEVCDHDEVFVHISHAERLSMRGSNGQFTGFEMLCDKLPSMKKSVFVLTGERAGLLQLISSHEQGRTLFPNVFHFEDLTPEAMMEYMKDYANRSNFLFDPAAEDSLREYLGYAYKLRGAHFRNTFYLEDLLNHEIVPRMAERVAGEEDIASVDLCTILPEDLPVIQHPDAASAFDKLEAMVGLDSIKKQIRDHTALVQLNSLRASKGLFNKMPPMHMVFTGNPGTGKTTIAKYIGEIYHSIGVLSSGHVVETERTKLVGEYIGVSEKNTLNAIKSAGGGVLFIDEAYNLFTDSDNKRDYGMRVIETLLTYLGSEEADLIVILAGYANEMKKMLEANPGMKSRFPYIFHFDDYTPDQLLQIGRKVLEQEHYVMTPEAERKLAKYVIHEYDHKDDHFGNGRFITRLITTHIIPSLSQRILAKSAEEISDEDMTTIRECDIPEVVSHDQRPNELDETILTESLERLDRLMGLTNVKQAIRDYVAISRLRHRQGTLKISARSLSWNFIGKTGTGKSTVAEILGKVMQGLGILKRGQTVIVNAEELMGGDSYVVLERALAEAKDGLLFLDLDAPSAANLNIRQLSLWTFNKLRELRQITALVFAKERASNDMVAQNLTANGISSYGNSIVFKDYTAVELADILTYVLHHDYHLEVTPEAQAHMLNYMEAIHKNETKDSPVNARVVVHLAQTIANIALLRTVNDDGERLVTLPDVVHFKWNGKAKGSVGYV